MTVQYVVKPAGIRPQADFLKDLNPQQLEAVTAPDGPVLIVAGAGSGKTRTLLYRLAYLLQRGVSPQGIALCTFTNKAAREMLRRLEQLAPQSARLVWGGTFHHLANRLLREFAAEAGLRPDYTILDHQDSLDLFEQLAEELSSRSSTMPPGPQLMRELVSLAVNTLRPLEEIVLERAPRLVPQLGVVLELARQYQEKKRQANALDFDDLLLKLLELVETNAGVHQKISERFLHLLVDEYQDTNQLQVRLLDRLAAAYRNLTAVGDDAQAIYTFRGASPRFMLDFEKRWPGARLYRLETNYRSTPPILEVANLCLERARELIPKRLVAVRQGGTPPALVVVRDQHMEAAFVAQRLQELHAEGVPLSQMAALYRAHAHSLELQLELSRRQIPYSVRSGLRFFEQAHIKDVLAYLRILDNPRDSLSWRRLLRLQAGIGKRGAERLTAWLIETEDPWQRLVANERPPVRQTAGWEAVRGMLLQLRQNPNLTAGELIGLVLELGYREILVRQYPDAESRLEDLEQLKNYAGNFNSLRQMLAELHLLGEFGAEREPGREPAEDRVVLSTVHQAKGLEWKCVFVIGLIEGSFPHSLALREAGGEEEERRLFYVALTRAQDELYLVSPQVVDRSGDRRALKKPCRFLREIERACHRWQVVEP
jgi:DNA helicase-2/ATP-dependent DNA helicase PcrA